MTTCLGKNCSFGLCVSFVNVCYFVRAYFPFGFEGRTNAWRLTPVPGPLDRAQSGLTG